MTELLAKDTGETIEQHSINVAEVARIICERLPLPESKKKDLSTHLFELGLLHDIGKASPGFQKMLSDGISWKHRHEILSAAISGQIALHLDEEDLLVIITHHKSIPASVDGTTFEKCLPDNELPFLKPNVFEELLSELGRPSDSLLTLLSRLSEYGKCQWELTSLSFESTGLGKLKYQWLLRGVDGQIQVAPHEKRKWASLLRGLLITADHLASAGHKELPKIPIIADHKKQILASELRGSDILPFQERCASIAGSGIIKAPTGSGKTLAILLWAAHNQSKNGRFCYTLPYTASLNSMFKRMSKMFPEASVGILHHKNAAFLYRLYENDHSVHAEKHAKNLAGLARELYFPIKVLTPHQILRVALRGKGWELGLAEFPNACFVFDEIHAYEPLIVGLIVATAKWLQSMGAKLLFASATMPLFIENLLKAELHISDSNVITPDTSNEKDRSICDKKRHRIVVSEGSLLSNLDDVITKINRHSGTKVLIVCNYVATSQEVCRQLENNGITNYTLLHARFNNEDRSRIEEAITSKNPPRILVATQAVEVSLDIDYDCGFIEPAPIDALAQRFGRINRKGECPPASITVYENDSVDSKRPIYDPTLVSTTIELLKKKDVLSENDLTDILNSVYEKGFTGVSLTSYEQGLNHRSIKEFDKTIIAGTYEPWIENLIEKTDGQIEVLPFKGVDLHEHEISLKDEYSDRLKNHEYLKARLLLVPVRMVQFQIAKKKGLIKRDENIDEWVTTLKYSSKLGLDLKNQFDTII